MRVEDLDALERVMLANLLDGRRPQRRPSESPARTNRQQQQQPPRQRRQGRPAPRAVIPAPAPSPAASANRDATRVLDIGRVIKQIDPRTTPEQRHAMAVHWARLDLTAAQVQAWLAAGILPVQHKLVGMCLDRQLTPEDMKTRVDGVRLVDRLGSEGVDRVVALLRPGTGAGPA